MQIKSGTDSPSLRAGAAVAIPDPEAWGQSVQHVTTTELFLAAMVIIFAVPWLVWRVFRTDYFAPLVVVQVVTGIVFGPGVFGAAFPEWHKAIFTVEVIGALNGVAWWGVMLFVFVAGAELDVRQAWQRRRETGTTAFLALSLPLASGAGAAWLHQHGDVLDHWVDGDRAVYEVRIAPRDYDRFGMRS